MSANSSALAASACSSRSSAGSSRLAASSSAARWTADGKTSLDDCPMFTWSLGCAPSPASVAMTSLAFMFDDVPQPGVQQPQLGVRPCGGALDAAEPADDRQRHALSGNGEVRDGLRGLAAPQL